MKSIPNKKISDDEFNILKSLKNNKNIIICRAAKGNSIIVLDKTDYVQKTGENLKLKQFQCTKKLLLNETHKFINKHILQLLNDKIIDKTTI